MKRMTVLVQREQPGLVCSPVPGSGKQSINIGLVLGVVRQRAGVRGETK